MPSPAAEQACNRFLDWASPRPVKLLRLRLANFTFTDAASDSPRSQARRDEADGRAGGTEGSSLVVCNGQGYHVACGNPLPRDLGGDQT